jgi:hypothetical protein
MKTNTTTSKPNRAAKQMTDGGWMTRLVRKVSSLLQVALYGVIVAALLWVTISTMIFRFRHPWATETEIFLHIPDAFMLRKVPYSEMRDRE